MGWAERYNRRQRGIRTAAERAEQERNAQADARRLARERDAARAQRVGLGRWLLRRLGVISS